MGNTIVTGALTVPIQPSPPTDTYDDWMCTSFKQGDLAQVNRICGRAWYGDEEESKVFAQVAFDINLEAFDEGELIVFKGNGRTINPFIRDEGYETIVLDPTFVPTLQVPTARVVREEIAMFLPPYVGAGNLITCIILGGCEDIETPGVFVYADKLAYYFGEDEVKIGIMGEVSSEGNLSPFGL